MIYIDLEHNPPPAEFIAEGEALTRQLMLLDPEERNKFIDDNADYWGRLKPHYEKLSNGKCWYSESKDGASIYHMDHFRPKKEVKELKRDCTIQTTNSSEAYWWLAFDWINYRFTASISNTSKNAYFPLQLGTFAAKSKAEIKDEWPGLLDPTDEYDVTLIGFDTDGKIYPACGDMNCWDALRVSLSVRVYNLNHITLVDARKEIQQACRTKINQIKKVQRDYAKTHSPVYRDFLKQYISELKNMTKSDSEFSAVARNYIRNDPEEFIRNIAG